MKNRSPTPLIAAACALLVPLLLLLDYLGGPASTQSGWAILERLDVVVVIFCVAAAVLLVVAPLAERRVSYAAAAALLFAVFGLVVALPIEYPAQAPAGVEAKVGGYLAPLIALVAAGAALFAAERAPRD